MTSGTRRAAQARLGGAEEVRRKPALPRPLVGSVLDANGIEQFGITEAVIPLSDGGFQVNLSVAFTPPGSLHVVAGEYSARESESDD